MLEALCSIFKAGINGDERAGVARSLHFHLFWGRTTSQKGGGLKNVSLENRVSRHSAMTR